MSHRLPSGGKLIDRGRTVSFSFDGRVLQGYAGDTLASALLAADTMLVGRSFKFHRPRGIVASGAEEPNALMGVGRGAQSEPNQRATTTGIHDGMQAVSQNRWPGLRFDLGAAAWAFRAMLGAGFYYKTFIHPRRFWKHLYEPAIRRAAGLGRAPEEPDPDRYEQIYAFCDLLVAGGGVAGLTAALAAARRGERVILAEQAHWGGRLAVGGVPVGGVPADAWIAATLAELAAAPNVTLLSRTEVLGLHDHGHAVACQHLAGHRPGSTLPRQRLWRVRAGRVVVATGAIERPLAFAGNDVPGVMLASAVRDYLVNWAVSPGRRNLVVTNNDDAYRTALALHAAGQEVAAVVDARPEARGDLPNRVRALGIEVREGIAVERVHGGRRVRHVTLCRHGGSGGAIADRIACDAVAMSGGWSPAVHLWSQIGGGLVWDDAQAMFRPDPDRAPTNHDGKPMVVCVGSAAGLVDTAAVLADAHRAVHGRKADLPKAAPEPPEAPILPVWLMPENAGRDHRARAFLDFQNDVKVSDVELAAQEGYVSVEHAKRYTTLGMASDQGKLSNINGLAILARAQGLPIPEIGTTTFRPPYVPLTLGAIAAEARGSLFQPLRRTPIHDWHDAHGAEWEPVGQWRRPFCFPRAGESREQAVAREVRAVRSGVGMLDASTLGKLIVRGPDAARFLDMIYTGRMSSLEPGRCRYGLICDENGFVIDDGVVARLGPQTFLCHTTTGGAGRIHGWMEDWLQCEWWDWRVHVADLTEQFAQVVVAGPAARRLLERLGGPDLSAGALPFMRWTEGRLGGHDARIFRISFSGEMSYEVAVPAGEGLALWERLLGAGADLGVTPYGTEALHVLRAEKGHIMIGDETDGTVTPHDLGLGWAVAKGKADFIGRRGLERSHLAARDRWRLVGLETPGGELLPHGALAVADGINANGQRETQGRVTSAYHSPTLGRPIALGLVRNGAERLGEPLDFHAGRGEGGERLIRARIVAPAFYDPEGARLHG